MGCLCLFSLGLACLVRGLPVVAFCASARAMAVLRVREGG